MSLGKITPIGQEKTEQAQRKHTVIRKKNTDQDESKKNGIDYKKSLKKKKDLNLAPNKRTF